MYGFRFFHFPELDSTMSEALRIYQASPHLLDSGICVVAGSQTHGRGQFDRKWDSSDGGLYCSFMYKPQFFEEHRLNDALYRLSHLLSTEIMRLCDIQVRIKLPNDLMLNHHKIGGVLIESDQGYGESLPLFVNIGIGLNLNQTSFPFALQTKATSIYKETSVFYDTSLFLQAFSSVVKHVFCYV